MPSQYPYRRTIQNDYLGKSRVVKAMSLAELNWQVNAQQEKWDEEEARIREKERDKAAREDLKAQAERQTVELRERIAELQGILHATLHVDDTIRWEALLDRRKFPEFKFEQPKPDRDAIRREILGSPPNEQEIRERMGVPFPRPIIEFVLPFLITRREQAERLAAGAYKNELREYREREKDAVAAYNEKVRQYNESLRLEKARYCRARDEFAEKQKAHNDEILAFRQQYESGSAAGIERYCQTVLQNSTYPSGISADSDTMFEESSKTFVVNFWLPSPTDVPRVAEYKFVAATKSIKEVAMKKDQHQSLYDELIHQIALRTIHEVIEADYAGGIQAVVFNGLVRGVDTKTGKDFSSCIITCEASRAVFEEFDLSRVKPMECIRGLKGITAGPLAELAPVRPIMNINRTDDRFIEAREVLNHLDAHSNLATMDWDDFEHLVRELFEKIFKKSGGEVKVTQASHDRGVDAIAFDPDPIRGGKFVIQAKRYNMVVPVSAVRDLYGTMINEGAAKGILVTTSHFGREAREFAKDKPITLIDGANLVYLFQEHGHEVFIELNSSA
jgi:restriction system protein